MNSSTRRAWKPRKGAVSEGQPGEGRWILTGVSNCLPRKPQLQDSRLQAEGEPLQVLRRRGLERQSSNSPPPPHHRHTTAAPISDLSLAAERSRCGEVFKLKPCRAWRTVEEKRRPRNNRERREQSARGALLETALGDAEAFPRARRPRLLRVEKTRPGESGKEAAGSCLELTCAPG